MCNDLNALIFESGNPTQEAVLTLCDRAIQALEASSPLELRAADSRAPVHIFTDGSFKGGEAGIGAVS